MRSREPVQALIAIAHGEHLDSALISKGADDTVKRPSEVLVLVNC